MRATATGLAAAVLVLAASAAHADPAFLLPQTCVPPNPIFYGPGACQGCLVRPQLLLPGACLPPYPYNGVLAFPRQARPPQGVPRVGCRGECPATPPRSGAGRPPSRRTRSRTARATSSCTGQQYND